MCEMTVFRHGETHYRTVTPTGRETNKVILGLLPAFCLDAVSELCFGEGETQEHSGLLDLKTEVRVQRLFSWAPKSLWMVTAAMKLKQACSLEEKL